MGKIKAKLYKKNILAYFIFLFFIILCLFIAFEMTGCENIVNQDKNNSKGCDGQTYPNPSTSLYVLPYAVGQSFKTGLTNCSGSFHAAGEPDQYAFDFDMPEGTDFVASRAGIVQTVVESASSSGGGVGNYLMIKHSDNTYAYYLHSPQNGIDVSVGDSVSQGQVLGQVGRSGQAGYPHLHFIVVKDPPQYPYSGLAISFKNAQPNHKVLQGNTVYKANPY